MQKVEVEFKTPIRIGENKLAGKIEVAKPDMGMIADASEIAPPRNPIGFQMAVIGGILDVPINTIRSMDPEDFLELVRVMDPVLPKI